MKYEVWSYKVCLTRPMGWLIAIRLCERGRLISDFILTECFLLLRLSLHRRRHVRGGKPRQHLVAHRQLIQRRRDRDRRVLHVLLDDALVVIQVRVMRVRVVFDRILAEPDAGQPGVVERRAVGAADRPAARGRRAGDAEICERRERLADDVAAADDGPNTLGAARAAGAGIDVQVGVQLRELGLLASRTSRNAPSRRPAIRAAPVPRRSTAPRESCGAAGRRAPSEGAPLPSSSRRRWRCRWRRSPSATNRGGRRASRLRPSCRCPGISAIAL